MTRLGLCLVAAFISSGCPTAKDPNKVRLLNVAYDPTRELWKDLNAAFIPKYQAETGITLEIQQSHGSSGGQARSIIDGLNGDLATLSIWSDTNALHKHGFIRDNWENAFPNRSLPYTSAMVFVVRKGNPKNIHDWPDLIKGDTVIITPSPKTSGNGKLSFLGAWGYIKATGGDDRQAQDFVTEIYKRVPVLDTGARGATSTFSQKGIGDVHLALESEAWLEVKESKNTLEIVYPPQSIIHEPHLAIVDRVVDERGTRQHAEAYLKFLYTPEAQDIISRHYFRPTDPEVVARYREQFPEMKMFTITDFAAGWDEAQQRFFVDNGIFDQIYLSLSRK